MKHRTGYWTHFFITMCCIQALNLVVANHVDGAAEKLAIIFALSWLSYPISRMCSNAAVKRTDEEDKS